MEKDKSTPSKTNHRQAGWSTYYALLGLHPSASVQQIRRSYRELSKLYHPDTTDLPATIAIQKFQQLNEAYATLSNSERRLIYDYKIGYSRFNVIQPPADLDRYSASQENRTKPSSSAYLSSSERPLSAGEVFALFILGLTFLSCLILILVIGLIRGDKAFQPLVWQTGDKATFQLPNMPSQQIILAPRSPVLPEKNMKGKPRYFNI